MKAGTGAGLVLTMGPTLVHAQATPAASPVASPVADATAGPAFEPIALTEGDELVVAANHVAVPFLRWGEPIFADAPAFDFANQTAEAQSQQAGYNCDWIGFYPLPQGSTTSDHGLLVVNHEYTNPEMMFAGYLTAESGLCRKAARMSRSCSSTRHRRSSTSSWRPTA